VKFLLAVLAACLLGIAFLRSPWSRISLEAATVVLPAAASSPAPAATDDVLAIIFSGDGGWADLDKQLGDAFVANGLPVLGVSTFRYYWRARTADESAAQLDALISRYLATWNKRRVWLIGFSFGADVLPSIVAKLSPRNRAAIAQLVLLSPSRDLNFEIELEDYMASQGWLKEHLKSLLQWINPSPHYPALPPLQALQGQPPVECYYGDDERDVSLCAAAGVPTWLQVHAKRGGHHFDGGYLSLAKQLIDELPGKSTAGK
jgi:type IV secretory pathway VirJ component